MPRASPIRVLSVAHTAVSRDVGRMRYHHLATNCNLDVHLLAPRRWHEFGRSSVADPPDDPGITVHIERILASRLPFLKWYGHFYPKLRRVTERVQPDVIHLWEEPWSIVALHAALVRSKRMALVLEVDQNILKRLPPPFEAIRRFVLGRTDLILSRSAEAAAVVRACGFSGPIRSIGYGVDRSVFYPAADMRSSASAGPLLVGYTGRLVEEKGLDEILDAMARTHAPIALALMGDGPHKAHLQRRIAALNIGERVCMRGWGGPSEVADFLRRLDVAVLLTRTTPSVREQFGRAIIEAQSCGIPVIGSRCGAIPDVIGPGGWIVNERDPVMLAQLLQRLSQSPDEILTRRVLAIENATSRFDFQQIAAVLAEAWTEAHALRRNM